MTGAPGLEAHTGLRNRRTETHPTAEDEESPATNDVNISGIEERGERSCQSLLKVEEFLSSSKENSELEENKSYSAEDTDEKLSTKYKVEANNGPSKAKPVLATSEDGDQTVQKEAANLRCPNHVRGCEWTGKKNDLDQHLNRLPRNAQSEADGVEEVVEGCEYRLEVCPDCQKEVALKFMEAHLQKDPNHQVVPCELKHAGCNFECPRYQMARHEESNMLNHLSLISRLAKEERDKRVKLERIFKLTVAIALALFLYLCYVQYNARSAFAQLKDEHSNTCSELRKHESHLNLLQKSMDQSSHNWTSHTKAFKTHKSRLNSLKKSMDQSSHNWTSHTKAFKTQSNRLASLEGHLKSLQDSLDEADSRLSSNRRLIMDSSVKIDLLEHDVKKDLAPDLEGATSDLQQLRGEFEEVKSRLEELGFDVKELMGGFSKKYIDDTIQELKCKLFPKWITHC